MQRSSRSHASTQKRIAALARSQLGCFPAVTERQLAPARRNMPRTPSLSSLSPPLAVEMDAPPLPPSPDAADGRV